jgi:serine/threonine protein kinase
MEKGSFSSLDEYLESLNDERLPEREAALIFKNILHGMYYLHKQGICHRDIKLGNILIDPRDYSVKIIDFGFATVSGNTELTNYCGTPSYMCPELLKRESYIGWQADIWALGIVLYRLACGCRPFHGRLAFIKVRETS